jgi:hypothetical protein
MEAIIAQRRDMDCAVACLGWYFHLRYEDVFAEALKVGPLIRQGGLTVRQIQDVAKRLGYPLTRVHHSKVDLEEDVGILTVTWNDPAMQGVPTAMPWCCGRGRFSVRGCRRCGMRTCIWTSSGAASARCWWRHESPGEA